MKLKIHLYIDAQKVVTLHSILLILSPVITLFIHCAAKVTMNRLSKHLDHHLLCMRNPPILFVSNVNKSGKDGFPGE